MKSSENFTRQECAVIVTPFSIEYKHPCVHFCFSLFNRKVFCSFVVCVQLMSAIEYQIYIKQFIERVKMSSKQYIGSSESELHLFPLVLSIGHLYKYNLVVMCKSGI